VKKAEPRDMKLAADCQFDGTSSVITETNDRPAAAAAAAAEVDNARDDDDDDDDATISTPFTGSLFSYCACARAIK